MDRTTEVRRKPPRWMDEIGWTVRQREVLDLLAEGRTNPEIGQALGVSLDGAKWHVSEVMSKLGVHSREEAAEYWRTHKSLRARLGRGAGIFAYPSLWKFGLAGAALLGATAVTAALVLGGGANDDSASSGAPEITSPSPTRTVGAAVAALTTTPTPSATPTMQAFSTPVADPTGTHPRGTRTGDPNIDRVIELVEAGDADGLVDHATWTPQPCKTTPNPSGATVICPAGAEEGTLFPAFFLAHIEGGWQTDPEWVRTFIESMVPDARFLIGVVALPADAEGKVLVSILFGRSLTDDAVPTFTLNASGEFVAASRERSPLGFGDQGTWILPPVR